MRHSLWNWETGTARYKGLGLGIEGVSVEASRNWVLAFRIRRITRTWQLSILIGDGIGGGSSHGWYTVLWWR